MSLAGVYSNQNVSVECVPSQRCSCTALESSIPLQTRDEYSTQSTTTQFSRLAKTIAGSLCKGAMLVYRGLIRYTQYRMPIESSRPFHETPLLLSSSLMYMCYDHSQCTRLRNTVFRKQPLRHPHDFLPFLKWRAFFSFAA